MEVTSTNLKLQATIRNRLGISHGKHVMKAINVFKQLEHKLKPTLGYEIMLLLNEKKIPTPTKYRWLGGYKPDRVYDTNETLTILVKTVNYLWNHQKVK